MADIERALRQAMADDVASVVVPAGLVGQVRTRHRVHQRRVRASASLASLAVVLVSIPMVLAAMQPEDLLLPAEPAVDEVDGVELTYLPDRLRRDPVDGFDLGGGSLTDSGWSGWTAVTGRWRPGGAEPGGSYGQGVRLTVFRGRYVDALPVLAAAVLDEGFPPPEQDGRIVLHTPQEDGDGQWLDVFWRATEEVALRVRVSDDLTGEVEKIIDGARVVGAGAPPPVEAAWDGPPPPAGLCAPVTNREVIGEPGEHDWSGYGGVRLDHLPQELAGGGFDWSTAARGLVDTAESGRWVYRFAWRYPRDDSRPLSVQVTCGDRAPQDADELRTYLAGSGGAAPEPYQMPDRQPAFVVPDHFDAPGQGQRVAWLERPGAMVEVSLSPELAPERDAVVSGVVIDSPD